MSRTLDRWPKAKSAILFSERVIKQGEKLLPNKPRLRIINPWSNKTTVSKEFKQKKKGRFYGNWYLIVRQAQGVFEINGITYSLSPSMKRIQEDIKDSKFDTQRYLKTINKKVSSILN